MGSVGGVALHFVAEPVAGKAPLELLGCKGDNACALVITDKDFSKKMQSPQPMAGRCQLLGWISLLCLWKSKNL